MTSRRSEGAAARGIGSTVLAAVVVLSATLIGVLGWQALASSFSTGASPFEVLRGDHDGVLDEADGVVPEGATAFDDELPAVALLDPALLDALRQAAADAADDGIQLYVNSGWRSAEYQEELLQEAVADHGSEEEAARWVATPERSAHVAGDAVDIGPSAATAWLSEHGSDYGLCQIYGNEPWHYELRPEAIGQGCPSLYADPTQDPRMQ